MAVLEAPNESKPHSDPVAQAKQASSTMLTSQILAMWEPLFKDPRLPACSQAFKDIVDKAAEIGDKLNTQRSVLLCKDIHDLPEYFVSGSRHLEPHSIHNRDLDDDEKCLDGGRILLVTQPLVVAMGKSDGSDYSTERILRKAVVWVEKPKNKPVKMVSQIAAPDQSSNNAHGHSMHIKKEQMR